MVIYLSVTIIVSILLGLLTGLGIGGGSLLMLWLTLALNMEHNVAKLINLFFFLPSAVISSVFRWKQGSLNIKKITPAIIGGCISAALFSTVSKYLDIALAKRLFGVLLLFTGLRELFYRPRKAK